MEGLTGASRLWGSGAPDSFWPRSSEGAPRHARSISGGPRAPAWGSPYRGKARVWCAAS